MARCILHVGMYKTGTTSIQQSLHGFADDRFVYADFGGHPNHSQAILRMLGHVTARMPALSDEEKREAVARFRRCLAAAGGRTLLFSGEGLVLLPQDKLEALRGYLRESFDRITIVAAVRAPAAFMASAYQERLKRQQNNGVRILKYRGYRADFEKFETVFGRDNVTLWKFDPASYPGGCAVRDFCARLDIALPEGRIARFNESLSREALGLLFIYRRHGVELGSMSMTGPQNFRLEQELRRIGSSRFRFSPDALRPILKSNRDDIAWMEARLGQSLHEELGEHRPGDVRDEADLLTLDPLAVSQLLAVLGPGAPRGNRGESLEDVAGLIHALRMRSTSPLEKLPFGKTALKLLGYAKMAVGMQRRDPY